METKAKYIAILPVRQQPNGCLPAFVVPHLLRIEDAAKYLSATTWQIEMLLRERVIPSFVLGKRRVVDRLELDRYVEHRNALARAEGDVSRDRFIWIMKQSRRQLLYPNRVQPYPVWIQMSIC